MVVTNKFNVLQYFIIIINVPDFYEFVHKFYNFKK